MLVAIVNIEVLGESCAVVGRDEVLDDAWQIEFLGKLQSFCNVADDDLCALQVGELVVRIDTSLVFGKEYRIGHLADVMIERTGTYQQTVGMNTVGYFGSQVSHGDGMLEGARSYLAQVSEQSLVGVGKLEECHVGDESKHLLDEVHHRVGEQQEDAVDDKIGVHARVDVEHLVVLHELKC